MISVAILLIKLVRKMCQKMKIKPKDKVEQFNQEENTGTTRNMINNSSNEITRKDTTKENYLKSINKNDIKFEEQKYPNFKNINENSPTQRINNRINNNDLMVIELI